jgi:hypothetical protein
MQISDHFPRNHAQGTGRLTVQLTGGDAFCYPLYYFIPSLSGDESTLIYHRAEAGEVQLHALDLPSGASTQLTQAAADDTHWMPWCVDSGRGVLDHRSVLNPVRSEVVYFDGNDVRVVRFRSPSNSERADGAGPVLIGDRLLFRLPDDRLAIGQNCVSTDGSWFIYIHHDRDSYAAIYPEDVFRPDRCGSQGTVLAAFNMDSGEHRDLVVINSPIHHVLPWKDDQFIFCHPATENGMLLTDLSGGWYTHLRTQDSKGGTVCHYVATERGIAYEVLGRSDGVWSGLYDPATHKRYEFRLPESFGYTHTGRDPEGRLWFYETAIGGRHELYALVHHDPDGSDEWRPLTGNWTTYGGGQKSHFHPQLTPDRRWVVMTGGDASSSTNHIYLLDVSDLSDTAGLPTL